MYIIYSTFSKFHSETSLLQNCIKVVLFPVDKATGNVVATYKRFYVKINISTWVRQRF